MNKLLRYLALSAVATMPMVASAELQGEGTEANPYKIGTAAELCEAYTKVAAGALTYFVQTADIDMTGVEKYTCLSGNNADYTSAINYDGQNHIIKNFAPKDRAATEDRGYYCTSIFGVATGTFKNLGIVNCNIETKQGAGALGAYAGHGNCTAASSTSFENIYVTGKIKCTNPNQGPDPAPSYCGGLVGTTAQDVTIKNCFVNIDLDGGYTYAAGLVGRLRNTLTINNTYTAGTVAGSNVALCVNSDKQDKFVVNNGLVAFNTGSTYGCKNANPMNSVTFANTAETKAAGLALVKSWPAYSVTATIDGYPAYASVIAGEGTEANPYKIATADDLCNAHALIPQTVATAKMIYFVQTADIDMAGVETYYAFNGFAGAAADSPAGVYAYPGQLTYDGQNHVIKNFAPKDRAAGTDKGYYCTSVFGVLNGAVKNLGVENANIETSQATGIFGAYAGHSTSIGCTVENCYVTGNLKTSYYGGGMFGTTGNTLSVKNSFANVTIEGTATNRQIAALVGRTDKATTLANVYTAGKVTSANADGAGLVCGGGTGSVAATNVVAFNTGATNASAVTATGTITLANTTATKVAGVLEVQTWAGFSATATVSGYPALDAASEGTPIQEPKVINDALTQQWLSAQIMAFSGSNWQNTANPRFATGKDGKMYTINMQTKCIAQVTENGIVDLYQLATTEDMYHGYYGSAIGIDEAGNFLLGRAFVQDNAEKQKYSSQVWAVYNVATGETTDYTIADMPAYRIDGVGRVLGDLTKEAYFYLAPNAPGNVSVIKVTPEKMEIVKSVAVEAGAQAAFVQPAYETLAEAKAGNVNDFYFVASKNYHVAYIDGELKEFAPYWGTSATSARLGFDTFTVGGKRYFVGSFNPKGDAQMGFTVMGEEGDAYFNWYDENYQSDTATNQITAEPNADGTVTIYVYSNGNSKGGAAGIFTFDPAKAEYPEGSRPKPYKISTVEDLQTWGEKMIIGSTYFTIENDIDMEGKEYSVPLQSDEYFKGRYVFIDGQNHVIKNLSAKGNRASLLGVFMGEIRNLGIENANFTEFGWGGGVIAAIAGHSSYPGTTIIDNCFVSGTATGGGAAGGFAGYNFYGKLAITNSYTTADVAGGWDAVGGVIGNTTTGGATTVSNVYAAGSVTSNSSAAAGISGVQAGVTVENVVAMNPTITGATAGAIFANAEIGENNYVWEGTMINGEAVENGASMLEIQQAILGWGTFNKKLADGYAVLTWQEANGLGLAVEAPDATVSATKDGEGEALATMYDLEGGKAYVTATAPEGLKIVYKFVAMPAEEPEAQAGEVEEDEDSIDNYTVADGAIEVDKDGLLYLVISDGENLGQARVTAFSGAATSGIAEIEAEAAANATYYNLQGVQVANPANGVYVRVANGKAAKVYVK